MDAPLVDGFIIRYAWHGHIPLAYVRGYDHPLGGVVAQPRGPAPPPRRIPCIGRKATVIPLSMVVSVISPWVAWRIALERGEIPDAIRILAEEVGARLVGLTGSRALGQSRASSDYDILVVPEDPWEAYRSLRRLQRRGIMRQCSSGRIISKRRGRSDVGVDPRHVNRSLVESCIGGAPFTLRLLRRSWSRPCEYWEQRYVRLGRVRIEASIASQGPESILVPARYRLRVLRGPIRGEELLLETWRTRYMGLAPGRYKVAGDLILDTRRGRLILSPDLWGGVWRV